MGTRGDEGPKVALGRALHPTWLGLQRAKGRCRTHSPPAPPPRRPPRSGSTGVLSTCLPASITAQGWSYRARRTRSRPPIHIPGSSFHAPRDFRGALWTKGGKAPFASGHSCNSAPPPNPMPSNTFPLLNANGPVFRGTAHRWAGVRSRKRSVSPPHPAAQTAVGQPRLQDLPRGPTAALRR